MITSVTLAVLYPAIYHLAMVAIFTPFTVQLMAYLTFKETLSPTTLHGKEHQKLSMYYA